MQGKKDGLRILKLKIEDPPRRKHTGVLHVEFNASRCYALQTLDVHAFFLLQYAVWQAARRIGLIIVRQAKAQSLQH